MCNKEEIGVRRRFLEPRYAARRWHFLCRKGRIAPEPLLLFLDSVIQFRFRFS
jgi:hypothetical protein